MKPEFFDSNLCLGLPDGKDVKACGSAEELTGKMKGWGCSRALVWHTVQKDHTPVEGNVLLSEAVRGRKVLSPSWALLPPQTGEVITEDFFQNMAEHGVRALRVFPSIHNYLLNRTVFGAFLDEVGRRRIPVFWGIEDSGNTWNEVYTFLGDYPDITCVLCDIGIWGRDRYTWPLMERYPNLYLETSYLSLENNGLSAAVRKFGADRFVFGTGFPFRYPEAAMLDLAHADMSGRDRRKIACGNLETLLDRARTGEP